MTIFVTTKPPLQLTNSSFPRTLDDALAFKDQLASQRFDTYVELSEKELICFEDVEYERTLFRWVFHYVEREWLLVEARELSESNDSLLRLIGDFTTSAEHTFRQGIAKMHLYNSNEWSSVAYKFGPPLDKLGIIVSHIPADILLVCEDQARRIGYSIQTAT